MVALALVGGLEDACNPSKCGIHAMQQGDEEESQEYCNFEEKVKGSDMNRDDKGSDIVNAGMNVSHDESAENTKLK